MFITKIGEYEYAVSFHRDGDREVQCVIKAGPVGMSPKDMSVISSGTCSRRAKQDRFDKGVAQAISLSNAMRRASIQHSSRQAIATAHRKAMEKQGMTTKVAV